MQSPAQPLGCWLRPQAVALLCALAWGSGCDREEVRVYRIEKEPSAAVAQADPHAGHDHAANPHGGMGVGAALPKLGWKLPPGWIEQKPSSMRIASFAVKDANGGVADIAVIPLPGVTGRDLDMVNMGRSQVRLEAIDAPEMDRLVSKAQIGGAEGKLFDMAAQAASEGETSPLRVVVALLDREGSAWFFKMTGPDALVSAQKTAFLEFLKSIEFRAENEAAATVAAAGAASPISPAVSAAPAGKPAWTAPAGWQESPAGQFLVAKFTITGEGNTQAAVNISMSAGEGGGLVGNVNRWRKQLGLSDQTPDEILKAVTSVEISGGKAMFVELTGTDAKSGQAAQLVGAMVPQSDRTWFYKLMGDGKIVEAQKAAFTQFVKSVKY